MSETTIPEGLPDWIANHVRLYFEDPDKGHDWDSTPVGGPGVLPALLLFTKGRKSGRQSILPLIYGRAGDALVLIASKGGAPQHPAWYLNLKANPNNEVQVKHDRFPVVARTAEGAERETLWRQMAEIYPPYDDYQVTAGDRQIPVVVLDPIS
jgi:deazaflavin-dependent oxidoreductase (nitroreductase family)